MLVAVCVGHSRPGDQGAISYGGVSERNFNGPVADMTVDGLEARGVPAFKVGRYEGNTYSKAMAWLGDYLTSRGATVAVELHFNAYNGMVEEEEYLYWHTSSEGKKLAKSLLAEHQKLDPDPESRGIKALSGDRGSGFVSETKCPAVICEPFFGDAKSDWEFWSQNKALLAEINVNGICRYLGVGEQPHDDDVVERPQAAESLEAIEREVAKLRTLLS